MNLFYGENLVRGGLVGGFLELRVRGQRLFELVVSFVVGLVHNFRQIVFGNDSDRVSMSTFLSLD